MNKTGETFNLDDLPPETVKRYLKYQNDFLTLLDTGIFDIKRGNATIHFDEGKIKKVSIETITYKD